MNLALSPYHKAGECSVLYVGTTDDISNDIDMSVIGKGCIAYDTTKKQFQVFMVDDTGTPVWVPLLLSHSELYNLIAPADDHTQYLNVDKVFQTLSVDLAVKEGVSIGTKQIHIEGGKLDTFVSKQSSSILLVFSHTAKTITRSDGGSFIDDGFVEGDIIKSNTPLNSSSFICILSRTNSVITLDYDSAITDESHIGILLTESRGYGRCESYGDVLGTAYQVDKDTLVSAEYDFLEGNTCLLIYSRKTDVDPFYVVGSHTALTLFSYTLHVGGCWAIIKAGEWFKVTSPSFNNGFRIVPSTAVVTIKRIPIL